MSTTTTESAAAGRRVPVDWSALASAFDNTAQHIRYFLHLETGALIRLVDGLADPDTRVRVEADPACVRVEAIAARDQYRWLQAFIPTVDDIELQVLLLQCLQGPGSFRRFKAVLSGRPDQLRRWRVFRMERIRAAILDWFGARGLVPASFEHAWPGAGAESMRSRAVDSARQQLHAMTSDLAPGDLHALTALAEFLRATRSGSHAPLVSSRRDAERPDGLGP
ncbi:hypothetical protein BE04_50600 [Sorangium cellulosum]|uniref:Uncharacterized protein n=2 Tax=Sorangium cellulosum TaxID=56 RepID=A0A150PZU0_SORCE|nr:UPF0158 family protein [Sorangium cellulosum]AGP41025.1 hypothetical protein SCE1572_44940 [Sorangium cellulosum So0157-2]KYF61202.1 hypothetical protein BE04_50600 [Sorangium cellulosum]KYG09628.1 hypothetical protein BE21_16840 [Sorangium cellulosum]